MPRDGTATRERILDAAQGLILQRGYAGMTVENILDAVGVTKGAFFYHFKSKDDLAKALIQRFAHQDAEVYSETRTRSEKLSDDPLQQMLIFIGLFEEMFADLTEAYPGCLFASYVYELQQFDQETGDVIKESFRKWRKLLREKFDAIVEQHPPKTKIDTVSLADAFTVVLEGAFITAKALEEPKVVAEQLRLFKNHVELLFDTGQAPRRSRRKGRDAAAAA